MKLGHSVPVSACAHCNTQRGVLFSVSPADADKPVPEAGDAVLCTVCGGFNVLREDLSLRHGTVEDWRRMTAEDAYALFVESRSAMFDRLRQAVGLKVPELVRQRAGS